ncbi:MAG: hypothetical protein HC866_14125 [Leptolyngbyaceae cyanobacterium RU_5_1]|nr:hypothetical protein [Leptolyngbyaceae cyanobacterium RU_5_1]
MADTPELTATEQETPQDLAEVIAELEQYRERLVNDTLSMAQRAKIQKAQVLARLEPDLSKIDAILQELRDRQTALTATN